MPDRRLAMADEPTTVDRRTQSGAKLAPDRYRVDTVG
jgi:hypothetical protein